MFDDLKLAYAVIEKATDTGPAILRHASTLGPTERGPFLVKAARHLLSYRDDATHYIRLPLDVQTFVESSEFLGCGDSIYAAVMDVLRDINSGNYTEAVLTGAIGTGKTTIALLTTIYQLHVLSCLRDPHDFFGLDPASEIVFVIQSLSGQVARDVAYQRLREMIDRSAYFQRHFAPSSRIRNELVFPHRIVVRPLSSRATAAIGSNVIGGILDEVNFMEVVEHSKKSTDGAVYDQALETYNSLARRRKSRFMASGGKLPGMLCLVSSKRYPGEFTDQKRLEAERERAITGRTSIFVYDRRLWEIKPPGSYGDGRFRLFLGDPTRKPEILSADVEVGLEDRRLVMEVPDEFRSEFERDMLSAVRDIAGNATFALHPFILDTAAVKSAFDCCPSILSTDRTDFVSNRPSIYPTRIVQPEEPRFAHVDLGLSRDSAGIAIGWVPKFVNVSRGDNTVQLMPHIQFDLILEVPPPRGGEIRFEDIRKLFIRLKEQGMNLKWISYDSFQSADSAQLLRQKGFVTGTRSMDKTALPYEVMRTAFYDKRIAAPTHDKALEEIVRLERDPRTGLIDHAPRFSKDCADAIAGVVFGLTYQREIWVRHQVPIRSSIERASSLEEQQAETKFVQPAI